MWCYSFTLWISLSCAPPVWHASDLISYQNWTFLRDLFATFPYHIFCVSHVVNVTEITAFSDRYDEFEKVNTEVIGVSVDSVVCNQDNLSDHT